MVTLNYILSSFLFLILVSTLVQGIGKSPRVNFRNVKVIPEPDVTKVNLIFMNHLDVGYSDHLVSLPGFTANVLNTYFNLHFPKAISLSNELRLKGYIERFRYTTHPWLLYFFLHCPPNLVLANIKVQCPNATTVKSMLEAISLGDVIWHDGPMNMNYENLNAFGLKVALNISANLNKEFKIVKPIRVVSLRDVPGLSRGVIRTFLENNVVAVSSGVNSGSAPPTVYKLCRWRAAPRSSNEKNPPEIIYMQNPTGYPDLVGLDPNHPGGMSDSDCFRAPGSTEVLCFDFRNDNTGPPQSIYEVLHAYEIVRARYVNAKLYAGTFEEFISIVWKNKHLLPVVDNEVGDTWIQGTATDPKKFARYRAMQREFEYYYKLGLPVTDVVVDASRFLIKPAEHTYGLDSCGDTINWTNEKFETIRQKPGITNSELSWTEQRQYETLVLDTLGPNHTLTKYILKAFQDLESIDFLKGHNKNNGRYKSIGSDFKLENGPYDFTCTNGPHVINISFQNGAISSLDAENMTINSKNLFGKLIYRTYNESDTDYFLKYYKTYWNTGYGKPNSTINAHPESKEWKIVVKEMYRKISSPCSFLAVLLAEDSRATTYYGFPELVFILWDINISNGEISTEVVWHNKKPTRLMESISFQFQPQIFGNNLQWYFSKMGEPISPYSVLKNGSQWQHNVDDSGVFVASAPDAKPVLRIIPWDTGITCPITDWDNTTLPTVWPAPLFPFTSNLTGVAFNFYNNIWNTNYIYWYPFSGPGTENDHQFKARFTTQVTLKTKIIDDNLRYVGDIHI